MNEVIIVMSLIVWPEETETGTGIETGTSTGTLIGIEGDEGPDLAPGHVRGVVTAPGPAIDTTGLIPGHGLGNAGEILLVLCMLLWFGKNLTQSIEC